MSRSQMLINNGDMIYDNSKLAFKRRTARFNQIASANTRAMVFQSTADNKYRLIVGSQNLSGVILNRLKNKQAAIEYKTNPIQNKIPASTAASMTKRMNELLLVVVYLSDVFDNHFISSDSFQREQSPVMNRRLAEFQFGSSELFVVVVII